MAKTHGLIATYASGCRCEPCRDALKRKNARRKRAHPTLPTSFLVTHLPKDFTSRYKKSLATWEDKGIPVFTADTICVEYGLHPWTVFGDLWYQDVWNDMEKETVNG